MHLRSLYVENYRSFPVATTVPLRPLTLFYGFNNTGKSGLLRTLPLLASSISSPNAGPLNLFCPAVRGATFNDLLCRYSSKPTIGLGMDFDASESSSIIGLRYWLRNLPEIRSHIVERLEILDTDPQNNIVIEWEPESPLPEDISYKITYHSENSEIIKIKFESLLPAMNGESQITLKVQHFIKQLIHFSDRFHWLSSLRNFPSRYNFPTPSYKMEANGYGAAHMLAHDYGRKGPVFPEVSTWYKNATQHLLDFWHGTSLSGEEPFSLVLCPQHNPTIKIPLTDTGEGMGQVLPVIVLGAMAKHGKLGDYPLLLIEHPEIHLQPTVHADLAQFFCDVIRSNPAPQILVETHSENLLLRVQLEIAQGLLDPKMVIVHWVRQTFSGQTMVDSIEFDQLARPIADRWPPGVFEKSLQQSREVLLARRNRQS